MTVLITFTGVVFLTLKPQPSSAQNEGFKSYQLLVFCENSSLAAATFWHEVTEGGTVGRPLMGLKTVCAGKKCSGGHVTLTAALAGLPADVSASLRAQVEKHRFAGEGWFLACLLKCEPDPYPDFLRKKQVTLELFKHASELRLKATKLVGERLGDEFENLRFDAELDVAGDQGWDKFGRHVIKGMGKSRGTLSGTWIARNARKAAPFGAKAWNAIGWMDLAVQTTYRGLVTAGDWSDYQKEAQEATKQAEDMWRKALADLEASLKQVPACVEASKKAAEEENNVDRAKAAIEKWDNNQSLYWDPIKNEAVTFEAALKRADAYLKSGKISQLFHNAAFRPVVFIADDEPSQQALGAAIKELDKAISSFNRLNVSISKYLSTQRSIELELEAAFSGKVFTEPVIPKEKAPAKKSGVETKLKFR